MNIILVKYRGIFFHNDDYAKFRELRKKELGDKPHKFMLGVDPKPIDDIARDLPLSRIERPEWDVEVFTKLGAAEISVVPALGCLKDEKLVLLSFSGYVKILSTKKM